MRWRYVWMSTVIVTVLCFIAASSKRKNLESGSFGFSTKYHSSTSGAPSSGVSSKVWGRSARSDEATYSSVFLSRSSRGSRTVVRASPPNASNPDLDSANRIGDIDEAMLPILHIHFIDLVDDTNARDARGTTKAPNRTKSSTRCELRFSRSAVSALSPALQELAARHLQSPNDANISTNNPAATSGEAEVKRYRSRSCFPHLLVQSTHPHSQRRLSISSDAAPLSLIDQLEAWVRRKALSRRSSTGVAKSSQQHHHQQAPSVAATEDTTSSLLNRRFSSLPRLRRFLDVLNETQALRARAAVDCCGTTGRDDGGHATVHVAAPPSRRQIHFLGVLISHHTTPQAAQAQAHRIKRWNSWLAQFLLSHGSFGGPVLPQANASHSKDVAVDSVAQKPQGQSSTPQHAVPNENDRVEIISLPSVLCATGRVSGIRGGGSVSRGATAGRAPPTEDPRVTFRQSEFCSSILGCDGAPISDERVSACSNGRIADDKDVGSEIHRGRGGAAAACCSRHHWPLLSWDDAPVRPMASDTRQPAAAVALAPTSKTISGEKLGELFVRRMLLQLQRQRP